MDSWSEQWPPGFRFHPTDEELILYYLKRKICRRPMKLNVIADVDVYKSDPDELPGLSQLKTGDRQWFFFSPRDRRYPNGGRSNRATRLGYWKATGKDRPIACNSRTVGLKKTLVFYKGRAPSGERTDWVMHEYTLDEEELKRCPAQDYYALYKVFKKSGPGPKNGEQYGAPFREEDWADDDKAVVSADTEPVLPLQQCSYQSLVNPLNGQFNNIQPCSYLAQSASSQFQGTSVTCVNNMSRQGFHESDVDFLEDFFELDARNISVGDQPFFNPPNVQFNNIQPCSNVAQSASSQFQGTSAVTCGNNMSRQVSHESELDFLEDFLELDDLEVTNQSIENPVHDFHIEDFDGLCELDLFQDVSMFLQDVGDAEPASEYLQ